MTVLQMLPSAMASINNSIVYCSKQHREQSFFVCMLIGFLTLLTCAVLSKAFTSVRKCVLSFNSSKTHC